MRVLVILLLLIAWILLAWLFVVTPRDMQAAEDEGRVVGGVQQMLFTLSPGVTKYWYGVVPLLLVVSGAAVLALVRGKSGEPE